MGESARAHLPVLLDEVIGSLAIRQDGIYIDGTFGRGGHSQAILQKLNDQGRVIGIDRDLEAIEAGRMLAAEDKRFSIEQGPFSILQETAERLGVAGKVNGLLFDLGVSSPQLDVAERGFSFLREGPLDMRMGQSEGITAASWIASAEARDMTYVFKRYGEERFSKRISHAIVAAREEQPITTTTQLAKIISDAVPVIRSKGKGKTIHPATRVFQAIRIFINDELGQVEKVLDQVLSVLAPGGRLAVISFHSLEDRLVKRFMKKAARGDDFPAGLPIKAEDLNQTMKVISRIRAGKEEIDLNPRSRSAVLRVAEKLG